MGVLFLNKLVNPNFQIQQFPNLCLGGIWIIVKMKTLKIGQILMRKNKLS